ncbi:CBM96 family carbohydrate-binding protein [Terrimonas pollutisoli]|uniref:CBM96 family carbohydrate-binding protein n=1 Tax=Terrimonas pollutisoli TaxID=3034147 RepID=UPI0023EDE826|nr:DNRLRE domain-containing protein [Terrimonas sp. H1YJ31]
MKQFLHIAMFLTLILSSLAMPAQEVEDQFKRTKTDHSNTEWYKELNSARPNYWKVKAEYEQFFSAHKTERSSQEKICRRWLEINAGNIDKDGYLLPQPGAEEQVAAFTKQQKIKMKDAARTSARTPETFAGETVGSWRMIGPFHAAKTRCGTSSVLSGGFTDRVYINPYNTNNMFAGTSYGGLWVSQDAGTSWRLTDGNFPNGTNTYANRDYYYGDFEASSQNAQLVYAATEAGLLKSTDGGNNWAYCNELNRTVNPTTRPYFIAVAHDDQTTVLSSFGRKIYRSTDGGNSWSVAFDNSAGGANKKFGNVHSAQPLGIHDRTYNFWGLDFHPADPNIVYIGVWNAANEPCIYKSTDKGATFSFLMNIIQASGRTTVYGNQGLEMIVVPAAPDKIFVRPYFNQDTIYHADVNGSIVNKIKPGTPLEGFAVDWRNENIVYAGFYGSSPNGSIVKKSTNAGVSFTDMTNGYGGCPKYVHPDLRGFSAVGDTVLVAHDGGLSRSFNGMTTIETIGYDISSIDLWGFSSSFKGDIVAAGCDHGPTKVRRYDGDGGWLEKGGGDANDCMVNPANDSLFYYNTGYGSFIGRVNADNTVSSSAITGIYPKLNLLEVHPNLYTTIYGIKGNEVKVSTENINNATVFKDFGQAVTRFRIARKDPKTMYVLLKNQAVQKSTDGGATWTTITPTSVQSNGQTTISDIELGALPGDIWLLYSGAQNACKVLTTTDGGANWANITGNLSVNAARQCVYQRGTNGGLYVYLDGAGVWYHNNASAAWQQLGTGLPMLGYSRNLHTVPAKNKFRMGSSRGAWEHELIETSGLDAQIAFDKNVLDRWSGIVNYRDFSAYHGAVTFEWSFPGGQPATSTAEFPSVSYTTPGVYPVTLTIRDANGNSSTQTIDSAITVIQEGEPGLQPIADAYVRDGGSASANFGTLEQLIVKKDAAGFNRVTYLKFDLSDNTDTINTATLQLFIQGAGSTVGSTQWQLWYCTNDNWTETGITWNNKPATVSLLSTQPGKTNGIAQWDITNQLKAEMNGDKMLTFAVVSTVAGSSADINFNSREIATALLRPQILTNVYPSLTLTQPANDDILAQGSTVRLKATAIDDNAVDSVQYFINGQHKATITQAPYEWDWTNLPPGSFGIRAKATNNLGFNSLSDSITVIVTDTAGGVQPVADAYVRDGASAASNFGAVQQLVVKKEVAGFNRVSYLKFDLSKYSGTHNAAKLRLFIQAANANVTATQWQLWKCDDDSWTETGINWNNKPVTTTLLGTQPGRKSGLVEWDIASHVNAEINGDKTLTLAIVGTVAGSTVDVNFNSREVANTVMRPMILINAYPVITLTQPSDGDSLIEGSSAIIQATATDDKGIANVKFLINGAVKATISQAPYEWNWADLLPGTYGIRVKATDNAGLSSLSDSITVIVKDTTAPVIDCPENIVVACDSSQCGAIINYTVSATDNVTTVPAIILTDGLNSGDVFPTGTTTVTHTATDFAGNSSSCSFTVTVNDTEKPLITAPANVSTYTDAGQNGATVSIGTATTSDNCAVASVTNDAPSFFPVGTTTVTWTVTDIHGNTNTATQTVTVQYRPSSFGPVTVFMGVTNSDNNGRRIDLLAELYLNGSLIGSGELLYQQVSGNALNNSKKFLVPMNVSNVIYTPNDVLQLKLFVRRVGGSGNFDVRLWYNADSTSSTGKGFSRVWKTTPEGPAGDFFYLRNGYLLDPSAVNAATNITLTATTTYQELGTWSTSPASKGVAFRNAQPEPDAITTDDASLKVNVSPNPSNADFKLLIQSKSEERIEISLMDSHGRIVKKTTATVGKKIQLGHGMRAGTYFVKVQQGAKRVVLKLIKL